MHQLQNKNNNNTKTIVLTLISEQIVLTLVSEHTNEHRQKFKIHSPRERRISAEVYGGGYYFRLLV